MNPSQRRLRSVSVTIGVTALVAAGITGCSPQYDANRGICVDPVTERRVADERCDDDGRSGGHYLWYYVRSGHAAPAVGSPYKAAPGTFSKQRPTAGTRHGGSDDGGHVTRGGFGGFGHSSS